MDIDTLGALAYFFETVGNLLVAVAFTGAVVAGSIIGFRAVNPDRVAKREITVRNVSIFGSDADEDDVLDAELLDEMVDTPKNPLDVWTPKTSTKAGTVKDKKSEEAEIVTAGKK